MTPVDPYSLELGSGRTLIAPLDPPEVWCAGVTYERSRDARMEESAVKDVYDLVYDAAPAGALPQGRRLPAHRRPGRADRDPRRLDVERARARDRARGRRARRGSSRYTIGNDVSSREIEGANPLYLTPGEGLRRRVRDRPGALHPAAGAARASRSSCGSPTRRARSSSRTRRRRRPMVRTFQELDRVARPREPRSAGIRAPRPERGSSHPTSFSLVPGNWVEIHVPEVGTLVNPVALATNLV